MADQVVIKFLLTKHFPAVRALGPLPGRQGPRPKPRTCGHVESESYVVTEMSGVANAHRGLARCGLPVRPLPGATRCNAHREEERGCAEHDRWNCKSCSDWKP